MNKRLVARAALVGLSLAVFTAQATAEDEDPPAPAASQPRLAPTHVYALSRCLELAEQNYPRLHESRWRLAQKKAQASQARTAPFSEMVFTAGGTLVPAVDGTALYSQQSDMPVSGNMQPAWQLGFDWTVPLWTFGKITNLWDASDAQVKVGEGEVLKERNDLRLAVRKAFYGVLLAHDALSLVSEVLERVNTYVKSMQEKVEDGDVDEIQLYKLSIQREDLLVRQSEARKQEAIALAGLRFFTGVTGAMSVPERPLRRLTHRLGPLAHYLSAARLYRPEVNMARAGVLAREAQVRIERAKFFPDLGLALTARATDAPSVRDQRNPFVRDVGHGQSYGVALALRYKLDFLPQAARYGQARAQLEEQRATERYALGGVGVEVEQAFREAEDAERRLDALTRAVGFAKKWLIQVQQGIDVGANEEGDVVDPAREYALRRFFQMTATFDYNVAVSKLAQATGWDSIATDTTDNE